MAGLGLSLRLADFAGLRRHGPSECRHTEVVDKRAAGCRALSSARRLSAAVADRKCDRIAAAQPANDRNGMYTGTTIEPAGGQEPAITSGRERPLVGSIGRWNKLNRLANHANYGPCWRPP
jgi:hypothetical protein